jgi:hypothetical protein
MEPFCRPQLQAVEMAVLLYSNQREVGHCTAEAENSPTDYYHADPNDCHSRTLSCRLDSPGLLCR